MTMGVIIHLESDILECGVKWASERNTRSKASSGEGISAGLFKILKDATAKVLRSMSANLENYVVATGLEKFIFPSNPKERQC